MGIQINGQTDTVTAIDGSITVGTDLSVPGVLTYDDVTNIDSVGVVTARSGIDIGTGVSITSPSSNVLTLGTNSVERLRITSGGNIGIGTDNPTERLHVDSGSDINSAVFQASSASSAELQLIGGSDAADRIRLRGDTSNNFMIFNGDSESVRINSSGNVGIGTDNPQSILHVSSPDNTGQLRVSSGANPDGVTLTSRNDGTGSQIIARGTDSHLRFYTTNSSDSILERLRIHSDGVIQTFNHAECLARKNNQSVTGGDASTHELGVDEFIFNRGGYTITSENIVVPKTGMYRCTIRWESHISSSAYSIRAMKCVPRVGNSISGTYTDHWHSVVPGPSSNTHWSFSDIYYLDLDANDQIDAQMQWYPYASRTESIDLSISLFYIG